MYVYTADVHPFDAISFCRSHVTAAMMLVALVSLSCLVTGHRFQHTPFTVQPPEAPFWSLALADSTAAASELSRTSRAILFDRRLAYDPNLPPELNLPPREIADDANVHPGFARQVSGLDVVGEVHRLEQLFGSHPVPALPPATASSRARQPSASGSVRDCSSAASLREASAASGLPTSYSYRRDTFDTKVKLSGASRAARPQGRGRPRGRSEGQVLGRRQQQQQVPARDLPVTHQPLVDEVDIMMPRPPYYRTVLRPPATVNVTAALSRALGQSSRSDCALQLKDR